MTNEQLVKEIQANNERKENLEKLYNQNRGLIAKAANRLKGYAEYDDLMQEGYIALAEAADRYDPNQGASFATYAFSYIYGSLQTYLRDNQHMISISAGMREKAMQYLKICEVYQKTTGEAVTVEAASVLLGISRERTERVINAARQLQIRSLSDPVPGTDDVTLESSIADPDDRIGQLVEDVADQQMSMQLWQCVDRLGGQKAEVLRKRYQDNMTLREIAQETGRSPGAVFQTHQQALSRLRRAKGFKAVSDYFRQNFYHGTRLGQFQRTWTSQPELYAMRMEGLKQAAERPPSEHRPESTESE